MEAKSATIRFYEELNDFLPAHQHKQDIIVHFHEHQTVKDLIDSLGVPLVAIDLILAQGHSVDFDYIVRDDDRISVYPMFEAFDISSVRRLSQNPLRQPQFIVAENLPKLASLMRVLGFDTANREGITDAITPDISAREQRIILTCDKDMLEQQGVTHGLLLRSTTPAEQVQEVVERLQLQRLCQPGTRCLSCNRLLRELSGDGIELKQELPHDIRESLDEICLCSMCRNECRTDDLYEDMEALMRSHKDLCT